MLISELEFDLIQSSLLSGQRRVPSRGLEQNLKAVCSLGLFSLFSALRTLGRREKLPVTLSICGDALYL
jgi:hypothetical protein